MNGEFIHHSFLNTVHLRKLWRITHAVFPEECNYCPGGIHSGDIRFFCEFKVVEMVFSRFDKWHISSTFFLNSLIARFLQKKEHN